MIREGHVWFWERVGARFPRATRQRELILETLSHTLGNRTHAATILGISIRALRNKLRDYAQSGVPVPPPQGAMPALAHVE